jgi:hypothetical protein
MSRTYRNKPDGSVGGDGNYRYQIPRYKVGSRKKTHHIVASGVRHENPDIQRFGEVVVRSALIEARLEAEARGQDHRGDSCETDAGTSGRTGCQNA